MEDYPQNIDKNRINYHKISPEGLILWHLSQKIQDFMDYHQKISLLEDKMMDYIHHFIMDEVKIKMRKMKIEIERWNLMM